MNLADFQRLYDYNSWANRRTLEACVPLSDEQFTRDLHSSFRSVRDTLVHILLVEWFWRERWLSLIHIYFSPAAADRFQRGEIGCRRVLVRRTSQPPLTPQPFHQKRCV